MNVILANAHIVYGLEDPAKVLQLIETCGRVSHSSGDSKTPETADQFVRKMIQLGHESVLEHSSITVRVECDRAMAQQWTRYDLLSFTLTICRHRLAAYTMESQRYVRYDQLVFVDPEFRDPDNPENHLKVTDCATREDIRPIYSNFYFMCYAAQEKYKDYTGANIPAEDARSILPNCTRTVFYTTANIRSWRHFFEQRCGIGAQHNIKRVAQELLFEFNKLIPACFEDLAIKYIPWSIQKK